MAGKLKYLKSCCRALCLLFSLFKVVLESLLLSMYSLLIAMAAGLHWIASYNSRKHSDTMDDGFKRTESSDISEMATGSSTDDEIRPSLSPKEGGSGRDSVFHRKLYPRAGMISLEELNKEAEDFITNFRKQLKTETEKVEMD